MAVMRRWGVVASRRWRAMVWCGLCLVCLSVLVLRDALPYLLPPPADHRTRRCPPPPVELDGCASWRPLQITHPTCGCTRKVLVLHDTCTDFIANDAAGYMTYTREYFGNSTCSDEATLRGPRQHVITLSRPPVTSTEDLAALNLTVDGILDVYKGWVVRIYTSITPETRKGLCSLVCANQNVDLCDVKRLPQPVHGLREEGWPGWKWGVLGDPLVSAWEVREVGSLVLPREAHAATQFINSDKCWHMMVDHPSHAADPLGSHLFGGKTSFGGAHLDQLRRRLLQVTTPEAVDHILVEELLPTMGKDIMTHDSITCSRTLGSVPFPSRRQPGQWVGMARPRPLSVPIVPPWEKITNPPAPNVKSSLERKSIEVSTQDGRALQGQRSSKSSNSQREAEVNEEAGIPVCHAACRHNLHPEWEYC